MRIWAPLVIGAAIATLLPLEGCTAPSITRGGFASPAPAARTWAVEETVRQAERSGTLARSDLESMVELLLADDALVRFVAIAGLVQLTGDAHGYRFFDPPHARFQAILVWREYALSARSAGTLVIIPPPSTLTPTGSTSGTRGVRG